MNSDILKSAVFSALMTLSGHSQSSEVPATQQLSMQPQIRSTYQKMIASKSALEMKQEILAIPDPSEQISQLLKVIIDSTAYPDVRSEVGSLLFDPDSRIKINLSHLELMSELYVLTEVHPIVLRQRPRSFMTDSGIQSFLLRAIAGVFDMYSDEALKVFDVKPLPRFKMLLEHAEVKNQGSPELLKRLKACQQMIIAGEVEIAKEVPSREAIEKDLNWKPGDEVIPLPKEPKHEGAKKTVAPPISGKEAENAKVPHRDSKKVQGICWGVGVAIVAGILCLVGLRFLSKGRA